jgi:hypothetical protein
MEDIQAVGPPVPIAAGTVYIAAYHTSSGYAATQNYFANALSNVPLAALSNSEQANGLYAYGTAGQFPGNSYLASNYWVFPVYCQVASCLQASSPGATATAQAQATGTAAAQTAQATQTPTCTVTIAAASNLPYFNSPLDTHIQQNSPGNLPVGTNVVVDLRSFIDFNIVRISNPSNLQGRWFYSGGGNVTAVPPSQCGGLLVENPGYAIRIVSDSVTSLDWTDFEKQEIRLAVEEIGTAFATVTTQGSSTPVQAFNRVYTTVPNGYPDYVLVVRANSGAESTLNLNPNGIPDVTVNFTDLNNNQVTGFYEDIDQGNCKAFEARQIPVNGNPVFMPSAIVCNGTLLNGPSDAPNTAQPPSPEAGEASQHTIVHEFGHIFDYLTATGVGLVTETIDGGPNAGVLGVSGSFVLGGCEAINTNNRSATVMGIFDDDWTRGRRGWGSAPPFSTFLQSLDSADPLEAAADMFLNWVYRTNRGGTTTITGYFTGGETAPTGGCTPLEQQQQIGQIPETWTGGGFYNRAPADNQDITATNTLFDWALSGDIRHALMNDIMSGIFNNKGW